MEWKENVLSIKQRELLLVCYSFLFYYIISPSVQYVFLDSYFPDLMSSLSSPMALLCLFSLFFISTFSLYPTLLFSQPIPQIHRSVMVVLTMAVNEWCCEVPVFMMHFPPLVGSLPALKTRENGSLSQPSDIIIHLRKQVTERPPAHVQYSTVLCFVWKSCSMLCSTLS